MHLVKHPVVRLIARIFGLLVLVSLLFSLVDVYRKREVIKEYEEAYNEAKAENDSLKQAIAEAQTPQYVEREARNKLSLVREGEIIVLVDTTKPQPQDKEVSGDASVPQAPESAGFTEPMWKQWWKVFF